MRGTIPIGPAGNRHIVAGSSPGRSSVLTADDPGATFDARPRAFGSVDVRRRLPDGRYGRTFLGHDAATDATVVVRTFDVDLDPAQRALLLDGLQRACDAPLQHASIGRPLACGMDGDRVYVVHSYLRGEPADEWLRTHGPRPLEELIAPVASAAAAIDFAAAAGVHHGAIAPRDLVLDGDAAGVTAWGIEQARASAGLTDAAPSHAGDLAAFASAVFELVTEDDALRAQHVFERAWSSNPEEQFDTALAFASALHQAIVAAPGPAADESVETERFIDIDGSGDVARADAFDVPLRMASHEASLEEAPIDERPIADEPVVTPARAPFERGALPASAVMEPRPARLTLAVVAVLMLIVGFGAGVLVGRQQAPAIAVSPQTPPATSSDLPQVPIAEPEIPAAAPAASARPATPAPSASARPATPAPPAEKPAPADTEAVLDIDSRPQGAEVRVDGRVVGRTPVIAGGLRAGTHVVRMDLADHKPWTTDVTVAAGEHARVGGSLEEQ